MLLNCCSHKRSAPNKTFDSEFTFLLLFIQQGYEHSCNDASMLYRVETMPGLGWYVLTKVFFFSDAYLKEKTNLIQHKTQSSQLVI